MKSGIFLFNNRQELISSISPEFLTENTQEIELNGLITATATTKYDKEIEEAEYFGVKELNNFWLYKIRTFQKKDGMITLKGIHILFDDLKGKVLRDIRQKNVTAKEGFNKILENSTWQVGVSTATTNSSASFYYKSTLTAFYEALKKWNCEFVPHIEFRNGKIISKTINLYDTISKDNGKWFEYGDKLLTVVAEMTKDIYTGFIGLGKGEQTENGGFGRKIKFDTVEWEKSKGNPIDKPLLQDYIEIKEATKRWGYPNGTPRIGIVEFSEVTDREELLNKTYLYAKENCRPKLQLKATTISDEMVEIGETCSIIRPDLKIRYRTRVFKIKKNFLNTDLIEFEFGDKVILSASDRVKADIEKEEKRQIELESRMESFLKTATNFYFNEDGYNYELKSDNKYKLPAGYYSFDKPIEENPSKVVYMGAGKILIADSKNPSGEWIWRTTITPQGIAGEEIVVNSITANKLSADVGQSLDLSSNQSINTNVTKVVEKEVSKITVGARNLLPNSYFFDKGKWQKWSSTKIEFSKISGIKDWNDLEIIKLSEINSEITSKIRAYYLIDSVKFDEEKKYTISFDVLNLSDFNLSFSLDKLKTNPSVDVKAKEKKRVSLTFNKKDFEEVMIAVKSELNQDPVFSIKNIKVEEGSIATTWTPAIEDLENIDDKLKNAIEYLESDNKDLINKISGLNFENKKIREEISTSLKQTKDEFNFIFNNYKELLDENNQVIKDRFNDFSRYIRFKNGNIELGDVNSPFKTLLTHEKISFFKNDLELAYMSNDKLYIKDVYIINSIRIGNFEIVPRQNGNLSLRKVVD